MAKLTFYDHDIMRTEGPIFNPAGSSNSQGNERPLKNSKPTS